MVDKTGKMRLIIGRITKKTQLKSKRYERAGINELLARRAARRKKLVDLTEEKAGVVEEINTLRGMLEQGVRSEGPHAVSTLSRKELLDAKRQLGLLTKQLERLTTSVAKAEKRIGKTADDIEYTMWLRRQVSVRPLYAFKAYRRLKQRGKKT